MQKRFGMRAVLGFGWDILPLLQRFLCVLIVTVMILALIVACATGMPTAMIVFLAFLICIQVALIVFDVWRTGHRILVRAQCTHAAQTHP